MTPQGVCPKRFDARVIRPVAQDTRCILQIIIAALCCHGPHDRRVPSLSKRARENHMCHIHTRRWLVDEDTGSLYRTTRFSKNMYSTPRDRLGKLVAGSVWPLVRIQVVLIRCPSQKDRRLDTAFRHNHIRQCLLASNRFRSHFAPVAGNCIRCVSVSSIVSDVRFAQHLLYWEYL
jgi:hypothetical protein